MLPRVKAVLPPLLTPQYLLRVAAHAEVLQERKLEVLSEVLFALVLVEFTQLLVASVFGVQVATPARGDAALAGCGAYVELSGLGVGKAVDPSHALESVVVRGHNLTSENPVELRVGQVHVVISVEPLPTVEDGKNLLDRCLAQEGVELEGVARIGIPPLWRLITSRPKKGA